MVRFIHSFLKMGVDINIHIFKITLEWLGRTAAYSPSVTAQHRHTPQQPK
jgi:hypothetical protein